MSTIVLPRRTAVRRRRGPGVAGVAAQLERAAGACSSALRARPRRRPRLGAPGAARPAGRDRACSTSGASARRAGPTPSTRRRSRPARRAGRRSSSARSTPPTSSPSTSRRRRCGSMALSARLFGVNAWSILVPQALDGRRHRRRAVRHRAPLVLGRRRAARRRGAGAHAGRRADVPVQQPRRAARAAADGRRLRRAAGARDGQHAVAGRSPARSSASGSSPRCCRRSSSLPAFGLVYLLAGADVVLAARLARPGRSALAHDRRRRLVGRHRRAVAGRQPPVHRRLAEQQRARA